MLSRQINYIIQNKIHTEAEISNDKRGFYFLHTTLLLCAKVLLEPKPFHIFVLLTFD